MVGEGFTGIGGLPGAFLSARTSSFTQFLSLTAPHLLPGRAVAGPVPVSAHGTTVLAVTFAGGVAVAGDRRATMGNLIAQRDLRKVVVADEYCVVGYSGSVGLGTELVRLFSLEVEHYEKVEGVALTLPGKANRLSAMIRGHLAMAMQGLAVVPLMAGYDPDAGQARVFGFDVVGGCYEERGFHAIGSGSPYARSSLKKTWNPGVSADDAVRLAVEALYDAADEDTATGGPDVVREIFPTVVTVTARGARELPEAEVAAVAEEVVTAHAENAHG